MMMSVKDEMMSVKMSVWWCGVVVGAVGALGVLGAASGQVIPGKAGAAGGDYNTVLPDGSFEFGYANEDRGGSYHAARGDAARVVGGRYGAREAGTGVNREIVYTAGPRGFRARGPNVHRKMDLDQRPRGPVGSPQDPYFDPSEDPSYSFEINTNSYSKKESADSRGDVKGHYSYIDDVGERHDVSYVAGRDTGFHVTSAHPDSPAGVAGSFYRAPLVRGETRQRGRSSVHRGLDGSYRFVSAGPDQRRTESSDSRGNVRGSYSFLDDKGVQRTVHYIAGPGIGYRIVKNGKDPFIPAYFPTMAVPYDTDTDGYDLFRTPEGTSASGHVKPRPFDKKKDDNGGKGKTGKPGRRPYRPTKPAVRPNPDSGNQDTAIKHGYDYQPQTSFHKDDKSNKKEKNNDHEHNTEDKDFSDKASNTFLSDDKPSTGVNAESSKSDIGFILDHSNPGSTVIKNIGEDYFSVPPGVAVRAHVQSIDLFPFGSKRLTPGEAIETVKT